MTSFGSIWLKRSNKEVTRGGLFWGTGTKLFIILTAGLYGRQFVSREGNLR